MNCFALALGYRALDPPPFAWLSGVASLASLYLVILILTTQRGDDRLTERLECLNLQVTILSEQKIAKVVALLEELRHDSPHLHDRIDELAEGMAQPVDPHRDRRNHGEPVNAPSDLGGVKQSKWPTFRDVLGPGLITGASDDDRSGIATYSQAGAQFGYSLGWTLLFTYPLMCAIQLISAQIGRVTGRGLAGNIRHYFPAWLLDPLIGLLIIANTINLGADLGAMAAALHLLVDGPVIVYVVGFAIVTVLAEVFISYARYASVLR